MSQSRNWLLRIVKFSGFHREALDVAAGGDAGVAGEAVDQVAVEDEVGRVVVDVVGAVVADADPELLVEVVALAGADVVVLEGDIVGATEQECLEVESFDPDVVDGLVHTCPGRAHVEARRVTLGAVVAHEEVGAVAEELDPVAGADRHRLRGHDSASGRAEGDIGRALLLRSVDRLVRIGAAGDLDNAHHSPQPGRHDRTSYTVAACEHAFASDPDDDTNTLAAPPGGGGGGAGLLQGLVAAVRTA